MKTFFDFVGERKIHEVAEMMVRLNIDSAALCEAVATHIRWANRNGVPIQEALANEGRWWNPFSWGTATDADKLADRGDQRGTTTTLGDKARRVRGTVSGLGNAVKGVFNGQGFGGHMAVGRSMSTLTGAIKNLQNLQANLNADTALSSKINNSDIGNGLTFTQAIDAISKQLTNMLREIENNQQAGKRTMTLDGPQVSGAGNKAMPYQPDGTRTPAPTPPPAAAA